MFFICVFCLSDVLLLFETPSSINPVFSQLWTVSVSWLIILDLSPNIVRWNVLSLQTASCFTGIYSLLRRVMYIVHFIPPVKETKLLSSEFWRALWIHLSISALAHKFTLALRAGEMWSAFLNAWSSSFKVPDGFHFLKRLLADVLPQMHMLVSQCVTHTLLSLKTQMCYRIQN